MVTRSQALVAAARLLDEAMAADIGTDTAARLVRQARHQIMTAYDAPERDTPYAALARERFTPAAGGWS